MTTLIVVLAFYLAAILVGRRSARMTIGIYAILFLLAVVQTAIVMIDMYSR